jgi:hypothetical protein
MPSLPSPVASASCESRPFGTSHKSPVTAFNPFRITYICKNAFVTPLGTHTSKTKDLKPFRITYFQKKGGGRGYSRCGCHPDRAFAEQSEASGGISLRFAGLRSRASYASPDSRRDRRFRLLSTLNCGLWTSLTTLLCFINLLCLLYLQG